MSERPQFVFGYGSLVVGAPILPARLRGHRRVWGVAMDNAVDIRGYKSYRSSTDGTRPAVFVAFLDIVRDASATTDGALLPADDALLRRLDARERNYDRVGVTDHIDGAPPGTVWAYRGSADGRARLARGRRDGTAVVAVDYIEAVRAALAVLGSEDDVDPGPLALMRLDRVEVPPVPVLTRAEGEMDRAARAEAVGEDRGGEAPARRRTPRR